MRTVRTLALISVLTGSLPGPIGSVQAQSPVLTTLHNFSDQNGDGWGPGGIVIGRYGELYGVTGLGGASTSCADGCGTVFRLTPPGSAGGSWTETILYSFTGQNGDGYSPNSTLVIGAGGALYGTTGGGGSSYCPGGCGTVFELTPPATEGGAWTERVLHSFTGQDGDGGGPCGLVIGVNGVLYGTTSIGGASNFGTVFELDPPAVAGGAWTETILRSFASNDGVNPFAAPVMGQNGELYGTTSGGGISDGGTVFELAPPSAPGGPWTYSVLFGFLVNYYGTGMWPHAGVVIGANGALYGATSEGGSDSCRFQGRSEGCGAAFELTPPAGPGAAWTAIVLHGFRGGGPGANSVTEDLAIGKNGVLYGAVFQSDRIFELTPGAPGRSWTETILYTFSSSCTNAALPGPLVIGDSGALYGSTGGCGTYDRGTVFELTP